MVITPELVTTITTTALAIKHADKPIAEVETDAGIIVGIVVGVILALVLIAVIIAATRHVLKSRKASRYTKSVHSAGSAIKVRLKASVHQKGKKSKVIAVSPATQAWGKRSGPTTKTV